MSFEQKKARNRDVAAMCLGGAEERFGRGNAHTNIITIRVKIQTTMSKDNATWLFQSTSFVIDFIQ